MLTALFVQNETQSGRVKTLINRLRGNKTTTEIYTAAGVVLRVITYFNRNGRINCTKLSRALGDCGEVLCSADTILPEGYERFKNSVFKSRLTVNFGVKVLSELKNISPDSAVALYDPDGDFSEAAKRISRYNNNLIVVSDNLSYYEIICAEILSDSGAVVTLSDNRRRLSDCRLVIAPDVIKESLPLPGDSVILTGGKPGTELSGMCYCEYNFRTPNMFRNIKPAEFSAEYFSGALYSLARQYELGSIVPASCFNNQVSQTSASICNYLSRN